MCEFSLVIRIYTPTLINIHPLVQKEKKHQDKNESESTQTNEILNHGYQHIEFHSANRQIAAFFLCLAESIINFFFAINYN